MKFSPKPQTLLALALLAPLAAPLVAQAQRAPAATVAAPRIVSMAVSADAALMPGSNVEFTVQGTPNARSASLTLANGITVPLRQISTGNYRGNYTVRRSDQLDPRGVVNIKMTHGKVVTTRSFSYPASFQAMMMGAAPARPAAVAVEPEIERFVMRHDGVFEPGREVQFRVRGAPGGRVFARIPGMDRVRLDEVRPGVYEGSYTLRRGDNYDALFGAEAVMRSGERRVTAQLDRDVVRPDFRSQR